MKKLLQKSKLIDIALNIKWVVVMIVLLSFQTINAQSPIYFTSGNYANPNNWSQGSAALLGTIVGTNIHTTTPNGTGSQYFRMYSATSGGTTYEPNGASDILLSTGAVTALQITGSGKAYYLNIANASSNVVFKTRGSGAPGTSTIVAYEIQGPIQTITGVAQSPIASAVNSISAVTVTATLSGSLSTGQGIWMRYTTNNYTSSTVVQLTGSGTTYTGTIPAQAAGANVSYYVFSSGTPASITGADADLATINLNNNGGSNYTYTVSPTQYTWNQTGTASWATAANWTPTRTTPATTDVLLFNNGATTTVNSVPTTQTIGGLLISNNTNVTFGTSTAAALTIGNNVTGADLSVAAGSSLNVLSNAVQSINVATGATGSIAGSMTFAGVSVATAHILTAADASGITFASGASFTQNTFNSGNVFGPSAGTSNSVVFTNGSTFNQYAGANPFVKTAPASIVVFQTGSNYIHNVSGGSGLGFSGRTYSNLTLAGGGTATLSGSSAVYMDNLTISNNTTLNIGMSGTGANISSINGNISVASGSTFNANGTGVSIQFNGNAQTISGTGAYTIATGQTINIPSGKTTSVQSNMTITGTGALTVNGTVDLGTSVFTGTGVFTLASGGTLRTANADGIYSSTATGSIRTTTRTFNTGANYVYNGTANQTTGTGLPATVASLTINNTGTSPTNVVTLTNACTTASVVLTAGKLDLNSKTLTVSSGGTLAATAGDFAATAGPVAFAGSGTVSGTVNFPTVTLAGGVNFGSASNIVTSLQINSGGFVNTNAPTYGSSSTLIYNTTGSYGRGTEWSATSGAGYPNHVQIQNGTTVDLSANGFADRAIAGNLNLGVVGAASAGSLSMGATTNKLTVGGNVVIGGNTSGTSVLTLSSAIGGDIYLSGNWDTKTNGSYASNTRAVFFQGSGTSTVTTIGAATFDYLFVNKTSGGTVSLANDMTVNNNLTLNAQLVTNSFKVIIPTGNNVTANPNGWVRGNLQKNIPTGTNSRTFEIGDSSNYTPVTLDYSGVTGAGNVIAYTTAGDHAQISSSDVDSSFSVNRNYTLTNSGVTGGSYDATFNFVAGDVDSGAITTAFGVSSYVNPTWTSATVSTRTSTSTKATGLTGYGDFQLGETATTWTAGASTTDWATSGNWSKGVPSVNMNAIIPSASLYPEISATAAANRMSVASGASVTVKSGYNLTVTDAIANSGTLTVENNANLKQTNNVSNTGSGSVVVKRDTATLIRQDYVLWSSPVDGQQLQAFSPLTLSTRFYTFDGSLGSAGQYVATSATGNFSTGTGYLIRLPNNHPTTATIWNGTFTGTGIHNGNYSLTGLNSSQYYAVGNPYPSTIDADLFIAGNSLADAMYFWRKTNNSSNPSYATYTLAGGVGTPGSGDPLGLTPNGVINVGQGFIVKTSGSATALNFTNGMRTTNNGNLFFRTNEVERNRIWLNMSNTSGIACQTMVSYMENATSGVDNMIDGLFLNDSQNALTSLIDGAEYAIQGRALPFESTDSVALGFKSELPGDFSIALDHVDGFFATEHDIFLKDNLTGTVHDLRTGAYTFTTAGGVDNTRFELVYENLLSVNPHDLVANQVIAYTRNNQLNIDSGAIKMARIEVYDIRGRLIAQEASIDVSKVVLNIPSTHQMLLVKITSENGQSVTKKVMN